MAATDKPIIWVGSSLKDLSAFPNEAKKTAGHQLRLVQQGQKPDMWKPMSTVGQGVEEIIVDTGDAFRVFYVAKFSEGVYVLHAFSKKSKKTSQGDIDLGKKRYSEVVRARKQG